HTTDAPLHEIAPVILKIKAGAFSLEAANPRHEHEYHVWEALKLPAGKILIPGVVAHTTNCVEHPELIAERIIRYARLVGRENVIAGVDCGFAQGLATARVHPSTMWEKFRMLAEGARLATRRLWSCRASRPRTSSAVAIADRADRVPLGAGERGLERALAPGGERAQARDALVGRRMRRQVP